MTWWTSLRSKMWKRCETRPRGAALGSEWIDDSGTDWRIRHNGQRSPRRESLVGGALDQGYSRPYEEATTDMSVSIAMLVVAGVLYLLVPSVPSKP